jgi:rod shape determining protein RodA
VKSNVDLDWVTLLATLILCIVGISMIYSVFHPPMNGVDAVEADDYFFKRQVLWLLFALIALFLGFALPFRVYETLAHVIYAVCIVMLVAVLIVPSSAGTQRWLVFGPIRLQPSEFTKIAVLFLWARLLAGHRGGSRRVKTLFAVIATFLIPFLLVLKQPDLGTAIVFFGLLLPVLYWSGVKGIHILYILTPLVTAFLVIYGDYSSELTAAADPDSVGSAGGSAWPIGLFIVFIFVVAYLRRAHLAESIALVMANLGVALITPLIWGDLKPYQQKRIVFFLEPGRDHLGSGWQVIQSKIAIGSGGLGGKGYLEGTQKALEFLPARHTDFIFSVVGEELGFVGAAVVLFLFAVLIVRALAISQKCKSQFASNVCIGIAAYLFLQVLVNAGMTMGMAPVTGIPLPFISYGGSSLVVSCFLIGFLLNCSRRWYEY